MKTLAATIATTLIGTGAFAQAVKWEVCSVQMTQEYKGQYFADSENERPTTGQKEVFVRKFDSGKLEIFDLVRDQQIVFDKEMPVQVMGTGLTDDIAYSVWLDYGLFEGENTKVVVEMIAMGEKEDEFPVVGEVWSYTSECFE